MAKKTLAGMSYQIDTAHVSTAKPTSSIIEYKTRKNTWADRVGTYTSNRRQRRGMENSKGAQFRISNTGNLLGAASSMK